VLAGRDLIVMDYRGTGLSVPLLVCGEKDGNTADPDFPARCRKRLLARGIDPACYRSADVAADIADLARALGLPKLALIGNSYGTRAAFTVLRDHPGLASSAVLDAATPIRSRPWIARSRVSPKIPPGISCSPLPRMAHCMRLAVGKRPRPSWPIPAAGRKLAYRWRGSISWPTSIRRAWRRPSGRETCSATRLRILAWNLVPEDGR
jgi:pimeloyl-ACP methyl ester carboxylesterase